MRDLPRQAHSVSKERFIDPASLENTEPNQFFAWPCAFGVSTRELQKACFDETKHQQLAVISGQALALVEEPSTDC